MSKKPTLTERVSELERELAEAKMELAILRANQQTIQVVPYYQNPYPWWYSTDTATTNVKGAVTWSLPNNNGGANA